MKKSIFLVLAVLVTIAACNFMRKQNEKPRVVFVTHKEAADTMRIASIDTSCIDSLTKLIEYSYLDSGRAKEMLIQSNFASFFTLQSPDDPKIFNGFYGEDRYRIEFYVKEVSVDTLNPFVVSLTGKCKYKTNITNFTGVVNIDSLFKFRDLTYDYRAFLKRSEIGSSLKFKGDTTFTSYHAKGTFVLVEDSNQAASGTFKGNFYLDFLPYYNHESGLTAYTLWFNTDNETKRGGFLFDGNWVSQRDTVTKPVIFAADLFMFANSILEDFSYGEREVEINPKYRALGWDNYWEAEEWWSDKDDAKVMMILKY